MFWKHVKKGALDVLTGLKTGRVSPASMNPAPMPSLRFPRLLFFLALSLSAQFLVAMVDFYVIDLHPALLPTFHEAMEMLP